MVGREALGEVRVLHGKEGIILLLFVKGFKFNLESYLFIDLVMSCGNIKIFPLTILLYTQ